MEKESVPQRVKQYLAHKRMSQSGFLLSLGLSRTYLASMGGFSREALTRIAEQYPDLNLNWLLTGSGEMLLGGADTTSAQIDANASGSGSQEERVHLLEALLHEKERALLAYERMFAALGDVR